MGVQGDRIFAAIATRGFPTQGPGRVQREWNLTVLDDRAAQRAIVRFCGSPWRARARLNTRLRRDPPCAADFG